MIKNKSNFRLAFLTKVFLVYFIASFSAYADDSIYQKNLVVMGKDTAPVKIKIFSSLTCPHCADFHTKIVPELKKNYVETGKVQLIFVDFPLDQAALNASILLHCVEQKKQMSFLDTIYENQDKWTSGNDINEINNNLKNIVKTLGISSAKFDVCLKDEVIVDKILNGRISGDKKYAINATPTIIINEKKLEGSVNFKNIKKKIKKII